MKSMKGWELYCHQVDSEIKYVLLSGTNRLKSEKEVLEAKEQMTLAQLLERLRGLEKGEFVMAEGGGIKAKNSEIISPPEEDKKAILSLCRSLQLNCQLTQ